MGLNATWVSLVFFFWITVLWNKMSKSHHPIVLCTGYFSRNYSKRGKIDQKASSTPHKWKYFWKLATWLCLCSIQTLKWAWGGEGGERFPVLALSRKNLMYIVYASI
jgi:hypothetical protein